MRLKFIFSLLFTLSLAIFAAAQENGPKTPPAQGGDFSSNPQPLKLPANTILLKGAAPAASDSTTPLPEDGNMAQNFYTNSYFGMSYPLPPGFTQKYAGPPPSDSGYYVLTEIEPSRQFKAAGAGTILISAQDLFFTRTPARSTLELIDFKKSKLGADYKVEHGPAEVKIANHSFVRMDYMSPVAELHWYTLATEIRCHYVEFLFTSRDAELLESLVRGMDKLTLPENAGPAAGKGGDSVPVCLKDYASGDNVLHRVEPVFSERRFNPIPVRITIDKYGKVKHIHVISAFPGQAKAITDAVIEWEFRPYRQNGQPVEVETGILFGGPPVQRRTRSSAARVAE
ncbi:MAG: energy transducer TonB [Candidatus Angelobacter sp.]